MAFTSCPKRCPFKVHLLKDELLIQHSTVSVIESLKLNIIMTCLTVRIWYDLSESAGWIWDCVIDGERCRGRDGRRKSSSSSLTDDVRKITALQIYTILFYGNEGAYPKAMKS